MAARPLVFAHRSNAGGRSPYSADEGEVPMTQVMRGVRVLEVAQFTFVPAAGGVMADWGADV